MVWPIIEVSHIFRTMSTWQYRRFRFNQFVYTVCILVLVKLVTMVSITKQTPNLPTCSTCKPHFIHNDFIYKVNKLISSMKCTNVYKQFELFITCNVNGNKVIRHASTIMLKQCHGMKNVVEKTVKNTNVQKSVWRTIITSYQGLTTSQHVCLNSEHIAISSLMTSDLAR